MRSLTKVSQQSPRGESTLQQMTEDDLKVSFAPLWVDKFYCILLILISLMASFIGARCFFSPPMSMLQCDRSAGVCRDTSGYLFGTTEFAMPIDKMRESRVVRGEQWHDEYRWVVATDKGEVDLGNRTSDDAQIENYRRLAADLQTFLSDPSRANFSAEYFSLGSPRGILLFIAIGALIWALGWIHGWRADLIFDNVTGTLTIRERPTFFLGSGERVIPISKVDHVGLSVTHVFALRVFQRYATVIIKGNQNRKLFVYRIPLINKKVEDSVSDHVQAMRNFLIRRIPQETPPPR